MVGYSGDFNIIQNELICHREIVSYGLDMLRWLLLMLLMMTVKEAGFLFCFMLRVREISLPTTAFNAVNFAIITK